MNRALLIILGVMICGKAVGGSECREENLSFESVLKTQSVTGPFDIVELEKEQMIVIRETGERKAFGYSNEEWEEIKSNLIEGDKIYFISLQDGHFYQDGHIVVREGCVIYFLLGIIT